MLTTQKQNQEIKLMESENNVACCMDPFPVADLSYCYN